MFHIAHIVFAFPLQKLSRHILELEYIYRQLDGHKQFDQVLHFSGGLMNKHNIFFFGIAGYFLFVKCIKSKHTLLFFY